jgi:hypothetical protein
MKPKYWWIKERHNPQIGLYYMAVGPLSVKDAQAMERARYGCNYMHKFAGEREYTARLEELRSQGKRVR